MSSSESKAPQRLLVIHTSGVRGVVGVSDGERVFAERLEAPGRHAASLLGSLERVLRDAGLALEAVDGVVVTLGPGSFTGIRIGLATAQGLAAARDWRVWACDSLLAEGATAASGLVAVVQDARRGEVYAALYDVNRPGGVPQERVAPFCAAPDAAAARLLAASGARACTLVGSGASLMSEALGASAGASLQETTRAVSLVAALVTLARVGACRQLGAHQLEPIYLRKSDAEIQRELNT